MKILFRLYRKCELRIHYYVLVLFMLSCNLLTANVDADTSKEPVTLDTIIVTSQRIKDFQTGDVDTEQTPAFFTVITREQFEGKMEDLSEVIEKEAGVQVRQSGGLGSFSSVSLRGSTSDQVMVFVDGIILNDASGHGVDLSNIALADVESIEIYRGITPINFGKASIGGVVNIKTRRVKKELIFNTGAGFGSFGTKKYDIFINHKPGRWDYLVSADYLDTDNDFEMLNDNGTEWNLQDDRYEDRNNAQVEQENLLAKFGVDVTNDVRIDVMNEWFSKYQGLPSWDNREEADATLSTDRNITTLKVTADNLGKYALNTFIRTSYSWKEEEYDDTHGAIGLGNQHNIYTTKRFGADAFIEWLTQFHTLSVSADFKYEEYGFEDLLERRIPRDSERTTFSTGIQDTMVLFRGRLTVTPGLRYTLIDDVLRSGINLLGAYLEGSTQHKDYLSPQMGIKYRVNRWLTLKSNVARYFREPSFYELFGDRGFFLGNPYLKAEEGTNYDVGLEADLKLPFKWVTYFGMTAAYFASDVDNRITPVYDARGVGKSVNISQSFVDGIEVGFHVDFFKYFRFSGNATWQNPENRSEIEAFNGKKLSGLFEESYFARIESNFKNFKIYVENVRDKGMYYDTANLIAAKDKEESNAGVSWLYEPFQFNMEVRNIGDNRYEDFNGYPLPGRSYFFNVKLKI